MSFLRILTAFCAVMLAACSTYKSRWDAARAAEGGTLEGAYEGRWFSTRASAAGGKLWCILKKSGAAEYTADFRATWHGIFASEHVAKLKVTRSGRRGAGVAEFADFRGEAEIAMWIGSGTYTCSGTIRGPLQPLEGADGGVKVAPHPGGLFTARYDSTYDTGEFRMRKARASNAREH